MRPGLSALMTRIDYQFQDVSILEAALTHPGVTALKKGHQFERLEFLGDRVLGLAVAAFLYHRFPDEKEGNLARRYSLLVSRAICTAVATSLGLERYMRVVNRDITPQSSVLADAVEAVLGALYLDGGLMPAHQFVERFWHTYLNHEYAPFQDPKSLLQEWAQSNQKHSHPPAYRVLSRKGEAHAPHFTVEVVLENGQSCQGEGLSKRIAERKAAQKMLELLQSQGLIK